MSAPLCIDLFCGTFSWSAGWRELGGRTIGFDIEHEAHHGAVPEGDELVLQDVTTLDGAQFKDASLILASPPCQEFSYMAMPWRRAKQIGRALRGTDAFPDGYKGSRTVEQLTTLFDACFRIQAEVSAAAGRHTPMVVENVRGAEAWVGKRAGKYGSFYLWGDVPALLPKAERAIKVGGFSWSNSDSPNYVGKAFNGEAAIKVAPQSSKSSARKAASARIAMIPLALSRAVAATYFPTTL